MANRIHQNVSLGRKLYDNARRRCDDARGLVEGAELCIRMDSRAKKIMYITAEENIYGRRVFQYLTEREVICAG